MANASILIVEDEQALAELYELWLTESYSVETATTGARALEMLDSEIDVVLLDRRMPGTSGDEVLHQLREQGYDCPVAMHSAVAPDYDILEMDIDAYNSKPINEATITTTVETVLRRSSYEEDVRQLLGLAERYAAVKSSITYSKSSTRDQLDDVAGELESRTHRLGSRMEALHDEDRRFLETHLAKLTQ